MKYLGPTQSGSVAGDTFSRNRWGQYVRRRAAPVNPASSPQGVVRARLAANAAAWRALTSAQRAGWASLGGLMARTDSIGQAYTLNGFAAYCSVNTNNVAAGNAVVSDAPALVTPSAVLTMPITLTAAAFSVAYTPTPLAAGQRLFVYTSPQTSAGRAYGNDLRLLQVSAAAAASPANVLAAYTARFGVPVVGNRVFVAGVVYASGFLSGPFMSSAIVA